MTICIVGGAGYVGLITGLCLSEIGHQVVNVDVDQERICELQAGKSYVSEKGIEDLLRRNLDSGRLSFSTDLAPVVESSDVVFIAVGTPSADNGQADLSQVTEVAQGLRWNTDTYKVLVIKSTVPSGAVELIQRVVGRDKQEGRDFDVVVNPEFLREGKGLNDFFYPDRIVIGTHSELARAMIRNIYEPIIHGKVSWPGRRSENNTHQPVPLVETDPMSAQMIKYASNAFLATQISFINEIAGVCERVGADVNEVVRGMRNDPRIGQAYLSPGIGFGGPCLGKDLNSLIQIAENKNYDLPLLKAVAERNDRQVGEIIDKLKAHLGRNLNQKTIAAFGLAFKAGTNDVRDSLALVAVDRLLLEGAVVRAYDPEAIPEASPVRPEFTYCHEPYQAVEGADALLILTEWPCFKELDYRHVKASMASPIIVDGRNLLDPASLAALGFSYTGVGRP